MLLRELSCGVVLSASGKRTPGGISCIGRDGLRGYNNVPSAFVSEMVVTVFRGRFIIMPCLHVVGIPTAWAYAAASPCVLVAHPSG